MDFAETPATLRAATVAIAAVSIVLIAWAVLRRLRRNGTWDTVVVLMAATVLCWILVVVAALTPPTPLPVYLALLLLPGLPAGMAFVISYIEGRRQRQAMMHRLVAVSMQGREDPQMR